MKLRLAQTLTAAICMTQLFVHAESLPELIDAVLTSHPSIRSQKAQGESAKDAVEGAKWQFFPTPSIGFEQASPTGGNDPNYNPAADKNVTTLRLQQPLWTGGRLTAGLDKAQAGVVLTQATLEGVGQLSVGLPVSVKIDAFDYSVYGMLSGDLVYVSPDTLSETTQSGQTQSYYRVKVHLPKIQAHNPKAIDILMKPGMTASIDIRTGTRSVLGYIAKPIYKAFGGALIER